MSSMEQDIKKVAADFNELVQKLVHKAQIKAKDDETIANLSTFHRRKGMLLQYSVFGVINLAAPKIYGYRTEIMSDDCGEKFFLGLNVIEEYKRNNIAITNDNAFVIALVGFVKTAYSTLRDVEKTELKNDVRALLKLSANYVHLTM